MIQYIEKAALLAEIERRVTAYQKNFDKADNKIARLSIDGRIAALKSLLLFVDPLEVKEVDLEKEIDNQIRLLCGVHTMEDDTNWYKGPYSELIVFAKHFFELGLNHIKSNKNE